MTRSLPPNPNLELLRKQAKHLAKQHRSGNIICCEQLRSLKPFQGLSDQDILAGELKLTDAQHALAKDYGFVSWKELVAQVNRGDSLKPLAGRLAYSSIELQGNGFVEDSLCLTLQSASRLLGRSIDYDTFLAVTTNAFGPGFDTGNEFKELWVAEAWVSAVAAVGTDWNQLGLAVNRIPFKQVSSTDGDTLPVEWVQQIRDMIADGQLIIVAEGWKPVYELEAVVEYWWAGILTEVQEDGTIRGAHTNGKRNVRLGKISPASVFTIAPCELVADEGQLFMGVLSRVVDRIRAKGQFVRGEFHAFGVDAMDDWIEQMRTVPLFSPPFDCGAETARRIAYVLSKRSKVAARFIRKNLENCNAAARPHIIAAGNHFEHIVKLLQAAILDEGEESYTAFVGDLDKQKMHAARVLQPVKDELCRAADSIEKALLA